MCIFALNNIMNFRKVERDARLMLHDLKERKIAELTAMMRSRKIAKAAAAVAGTAAVGALTGGVGLFGAGAILAFEVGLGCIATAVAGGAITGAAAGGAGTAAVYGVQELTNKKEPPAEKKKD